MNRVRKNWDCAASDIMGGDACQTTGLTGEEMGESLQRSNRMEGSLHQGTVGCGNHSVCGEYFSTLQYFNCKTLMTCVCAELRETGQEVEFDIVIEAFTSA